MIAIKHQPTPLLDGFYPCARDTITIFKVQPTRQFHNWKIWIWFIKDGICKKLGKYEENVNFFKGLYYSIYIYTTMPKFVYMCKDKCFLFFGGVAILIRDVSSNPVQGFCASLCTNTLGKE